MRKYSPLTVVSLLMLSIVVSCKKIKEDEKEYLENALNILTCNCLKEKSEEIKKVKEHHGLESSHKNLTICVFQKIHTTRIPFHRLEKVYNEPTSISTKNKSPYLPENYTYNTPNPYYIKKIVTKAKKNCQHSYSKI